MKEKRKKRGCDMIIYRRLHLHTLSLFPSLPPYICSPSPPPYSLSFCLRPAVTLTWIRKPGEFTGWSSISSLSTNYFFNALATDSELPRLSRRIYKPIIASPCDSKQRNRNVSMSRSSYVSGVLKVACFPLNALEIETEAIRNIIGASLIFLNCKRLKVGKFQRVELFKSAIT